MSRIGIHLSIGRGFKAMASQAAGLKCEAVQVFSRSPRGGRPKPLNLDDVRQMKDQLGRSNIEPLVVHVPYFVNLAAEADDIFTYSVETLALDLERASDLGAAYVVTHIGHGNPNGTFDPYERVAHAIELAMGRAKQAQGVSLLLENSAGQGKELGFRWDEIRRVLELTPYRLGICLDTCHAFAAGYDLKTPEGLSEVLREIDRGIGLGRLKLVHANDSKGSLGSHVDRHEHIGEGHIGLEGFSLMLHTEELQELPFILETPVDDEESNRKNLEAMRRAREAKLW
ncbi:MAG TPA: deoxyribonuclease IV [Firmicutes bacterium]|nr:deoxyribonuclease IV [Bacillota bacterium]